MPQAPPVSRNSLRIGITCCPSVGGSGILANHVLPALAGIKPNLTVKVEHHASSARMAEKG